MVDEIAYPAKAKPGMKQGVAFKVIEGNVITMRPALIITKDHCDMIVGALGKGLELVGSRL